VYKGALGRKSKKAVKMQSNGSNDLSKIKTSRFRFNFGISSAIEKVLSINIFAKCAIYLVMSVALICVFCYQPAKICYTQFRNTEKAEAELSLVQARNEQLNQNVEALKTNEGIEDKAKSDYGYVSKGDGVARVSGLNVDNSSNLPDYVDSNKVCASNTAASSILDAIFGYDNSPK
jgi:cell division protein FtsB